MERLWRPWRINYVRNIESLRDEQCIFCSRPAQDDDAQSLILYRGDTTYIIMNLYPYNTGHVMVTPYRHVGELEMLEEGELKELMDLTSLAIRAIKKDMSPQGFNLGINLGKAAGAGFDEHVHMHIVPRWQGDTNFMPVVGDSKVMPETIADTYERLRKSLESLLQDGM
ncbi:MAG: HIT domain-containing protein [Actinobacteria bacterium]|jgi:ATP adenylyltransferase|nr:MAG: HIT domain-containing protein [Actinomycetota bacterium]